MLFGADDPPAGGELLFSGGMAGKAIGNIASLSGHVTIKRGQNIIAEPVCGELVCQGDVVLTGSDGEVSLLFVDGTCIGLTADAAIALDGFSYDADNVAPSACFRTIKGRFAFLGGEIARRGRFVVETQKAQIR